MDAISRYELIRPILKQEKTVQEVYTGTGVPISTLYRYLKRFREGNGQIESLVDHSHAPHSHPRWFPPEQKDFVVRYKFENPEKSSRQIAKELSEQGILQMSYHTVSDILKQRQLEAKFFWTNPVS